MLARKRLLDYYERYSDRPSLNAIRKYRNGLKLNMIKRKPMYEEELNELDEVYVTTLKHLQKQDAELRPQLMYYMEEFLALNKQSEAIREKLDVLRAKTGKNETTGDQDE